MSHLTFQMFLQPSWYSLPGTSSAGVGHRDDLAAELRDLLRAVLRDVAGAGDDDDLAVVVGVGQVLERFLGEVAQTVAGGLGTSQGAAEGQALAGDDAALEAVDDALVLAVHVSDLASADADVARGSIGELADVTVQLGHKALAEAHDFLLGLALRVKVGAALAAAHGERGEGVLKDLLEAQELHDREVDGGMETQTAFVGADRGIVLHTVAAVDVGNAVVVHPGDTELYHALRLDKAFQQARFFPFGMFVDDELQGLEDFTHGLKEFGLVTVALLDLGIDALEIFVCKHGLTSLLFDHSRWPIMAGFIIVQTREINKNSCILNKVFLTIK